MVVRQISTLHPGTLNGGITLGQAGPLAAGGSAARFDGTSGRIILPGSLLQGTSVWTLEGFFNSVINLNGWAFGTDVGGGVSCDLIGARVSNEWTAFDMQHGSSITAPMTTNTWTHIVVTNDGTTLRLYVNGVLASSQASHFWVPVPEDVSIGGFGNGFWWSGLIAECACWNGVALSAGRVAAHYAAASSADPTAYPRAVLADKPAGYWRLNDPIGSATAYDSCCGLYFPTPVR